MAIEFNCPYCTAPIRVPDSAAGKRGTCPRCRTGILVPKVKPEKEKSGKSKAKELLPPEPAPETPAPKPSPEKKTSPRERFADEPDFTNFTGVERTPAEATPAVTEPAPSPVAAGGGSAPPPTPPHAAPLATPIAKSLRRRRRRPFLWVPILFGVLLIGGVSLFFLLTSKPKLDGELTGQVVAASKLPPRLIRPADIPVDKTQVAVVLRHLEETPFYPDEFAVTASDAGMQVRVKTTGRTELVEVDIGNRKELMAFFDKNAARLADDRRREYESGLKSFFSAAGRIVETGGVIPDDLFQQFHNRALVNSCIDVKGYHLVATLSGKAHYCFYQDGNRLYFLLPKGTRSFRLQGRRMPDGEVRVKANYFVNVKRTEETPVEKTAKSE